jgi:autonomous glycyl radical cofactor GrcA
MKNFIHDILVVSALASAVSLSAQTADEIVGKYVAAIGGKDAISQVKSVNTEAVITMMGAEHPSTSMLLDGVGYKNETDVNGTKIVQCYTDKGGWIVNPMAGSVSATAMPDDVYTAGKAQIRVGGSLYEYAARGGKIELLGKEGTAYKIKLTSKENVETIFLIDSTSYLATTVMSKAKMQDQDVAVTTKLSDYRKTELGYVVPYAIDVDFGGQFQLTIAVKKVELNKTIDPAVFAMPK